MTPEDLEQRLAGVARGWTKAHRATLMASTAWQDNWKPTDASFLLAIFITLTLAVLEIVVWGQVEVLEKAMPWRLESLGAIPGTAMLATLLALWLVNGWLVDRTIERACRRRAASRWERALRFAKGGVPLFGLYVIPEWHLPSDGRDEMASSPGGPRLDLRARPRKAEEGHRIPRWGRSIEGSILAAAWLFVPNVLFLFFAAAWIAAPRSASPWWLGGAILAGHVFSFWAIRSYVTGQTEWRPGDGGGRQLAAFLPWVWLLPMPVPFVCLLWVLSWNYRGGASKALTYRIYLRRSSLSQVPAWEALQERLALRREQRRWQWPWTRRNLNGGGGEEEQRRTSLYRLKTLVLALDGVFLGLAAVRLEQRFPAAVGDARVWLTYGAFTLAVVGFLTALVIGLGLRIESRDTVSVIAGYVGLTSLSWLAGLWNGIYMEQGRCHEIGALIMVTAQLGVVVGCFWLIANLLWRKLWPGSPSPGDTLLWIGLIFAVCLLGIGLMTVPQGAVLAAHIRTAALLSPVWNLGIALLFLNDFLRPFRLREALALRPRWKMAVLLLTLAAPLGGLFIPLWIWARHRWWPEWEREWRPDARLSASFHPATSVAASGAGEVS